MTPNTLQKTAVRAGTRPAASAAPTCRRRAPTAPACPRRAAPHQPLQSARAQDAACKALQLAALMAADILEQYKEQLPQQLMDLASVLHEYLLVRRWAGGGASRGQEEKDGAGSGTGAQGRAQACPARRWRVGWCSCQAAPSAAAQAPAQALPPQPQQQPTLPHPAHHPAHLRRPPQDLAEAPQYQDATAQLCARWWALGAPGKEHLIASTVPFLVSGEGGAPRGGWEGRAGHRGWGRAALHLQPVTGLRCAARQGLPALPAHQPTHLADAH
jgi:hypothetical protein